MTDLSNQNVILQPGTAGTEGIDKLMGGLVALIILVGGLLLSFNQTLASIAENAEERHIRGERLRAYHRRARWKKSDVSALKTLGVNVAAQKRMERLTGRGRPVVKDHQPLELVIESKLKAFVLFSPGATPQQRKEALKLWPYYEENVEALYRGEHAFAKQNRVSAPASHAEANVAAALIISPDTVHRISNKVRRKRKEGQDTANFPPMTVAEFKVWMATGKDPYEGPASSIIRLGSSDGR
jgi:hypothetical protein